MPYRDGHVTGHHVTGQGRDTTRRPLFRQRPLADVRHARLSIWTRWPGLGRRSRMRTMIEPGLTPAKFNNPSARACKTKTDGKLHKKCEMKRKKNGIRIQPLVAIFMSAYRTFRHCLVPRRPVWALTSAVNAEVNQAISGGFYQLARGSSISEGFTDKSGAVIRDTNSGEKAARSRNRRIRRSE